MKIAISLKVYCTECMIGTYLDYNNYSSYILNYNLLTNYQF